MRTLVVLCAPALMLGCHASEDARGSETTDGDRVLVVLIDEGGVAVPVVETAAAPVHTRGEVSEHATAMASILLGLGEGQRPLPAERVVLDVVPVPLTTGTGPGELADAITSAVGAGAQVIAIPMGTRSDEPRLAVAVEEAAAEGVVVLAAAGNIGPLTADFPARYDAAVSIEAQSRDGRLAPFSAAGDVGELGVDVPALDLEAGPTAVTGTSAATALVAHVVARAAVEGALEPLPDPDDLVRRLVNAH